MADYYKILEVTPDADEKEIRAAYRRLARQYHPDAGEGSSAEAFRAIQEAYDVLGDPERKRDYDSANFAGSPRPSDPCFAGHSYPSAHLDIRDVINARNKSARQPGTMRHTCYSVVGLDEQWDDLRDLFRRDLED
jgi:curved DNA-binding protein CbpA